MFNFSFPLIFFLTRINMLFMATLAFLPHAKPPIYPKTVVEQTFLKHSLGQQHLTLGQFRTTMKELGTDISKTNAHILLHQYGHNETISLLNMSEILDKSTTASPSLYLSLIHI